MFMPEFCTILGTKYMIQYKTSNEDKSLEECGGYCDFFDSRIIVKRFSEEDLKDKYITKNEDNFVKTVLRHEIVHAFLFEAGLANDSNSSQSWATNEEMVDWIAIISPKMFKVFQQLELI